MGFDCFEVIIGENLLFNIKKAIIAVTKSAYATFQAPP